MAATRASFFNMLPFLTPTFYADHEPLRRHLSRYRMRSTRSGATYHSSEVPHTPRTTPHTTSRRTGDVHQLRDRQSRDTAPPPTRKPRGRPPLRGRSPVQLQNSDALLQRGLLIQRGPARRPTLPPRLAPHIPGTPSGSTRLVVHCGSSSRRNGVSKPRCPRRKRPRPARPSRPRRCPKDGRCPPGGSASAAAHRPTARG